MYGQRLEALRNDRGLAKKEMAQILGIHESTYGKYELGKREPDFEMISRLAQYFDVSTDYLLGRTDVPKLEPPKNAKTELPPELSWSFINGYKEIDDDDRAMLNSMMERMKEAKRARDLVKAKG